MLHPVFQGRTLPESPEDEQLNPLRTVFIRPKVWHHFSNLRITKEKWIEMIIERKDYEFVLLSSRFCAKIAKYVRRLELNAVDVQTFVEQNVLFNYVLKHSQDFGTLTESFMRYKIENMRTAFAHLEDACKRSPGYNFLIGVDLGIEESLFEFSLN